MLIVNISVLVRKLPWLKTGTDYSKMFLNWWSGVFWGKIWEIEHEQKAPHGGTYSKRKQ